MPYTIEKKGRGYMVCDERRCFSKKPITKAMAMKQRVAIALSEHKKNPKTPMSAYFK
jgi:hypothetical protein